MTALYNRRARRGGGVRLGTHESEEVETAGGLLGVLEGLDNVLGLVELASLDGWVRERQRRRETGPTWGVSASSERNGEGETKPPATEAGASDMRRQEIRVATYTGRCEQCPARRCVQHRS